MLKQAAITFITGVSMLTSIACAQTDIQKLEVGKGWAQNSVNVTIFRNDPITTHGDQQYVSYYNADGSVVVASRTIGQKDWKEVVTQLKGNVKDAHNVISMIADGDGYLHLSWDHHGHPLRYARSKEPGKLEFTDVIPMTGKTETNVTYPQFYKMANGDLVFFYRDGMSGRGNLAMNYYDLKTKTWTQKHANLISGENQRNAYWQTCVDSKRSIHLSWVWRETGDVATNHDMAYARSDDGGTTWVKSDGTPYQIPITAGTAEYAAKIPQKHELMNQTSMCADNDGKPIIATYFRPEGTQVPQYFVIDKVGTNWRTTQVSDRKTPFTLGGVGSKQVPISRPQVVARTENGKTRIALIFRDAERDLKASIYHCDDLNKPKWSVKDLTDFSVRYWEPSYDHIRWDRDGVLSLFVQMTGQGDGEKLEQIEPQPVYVIDVNGL